MEKEKFIFLKPVEEVRAQQEEHLPHAPIIHNTQQKPVTAAIPYKLVALFIIVPNILYVLGAFFLMKPTLLQFFDTYRMELLTGRFDIAADILPSISFLQWLLLTQSYPYEVSLQTELGDANIATYFGIFCYPFIMLVLYRLLFAVCKMKFHTAKHALITAAVTSGVQGGLLALLALLATVQTEDVMGEYVFHFSPATVFIQAVVLHFILLVAVYFWRRDASLEPNKLLVAGSFAVADFVKFVTVVYVIGIGYMVAMDMYVHSPATMSVLNYFLLNGVYALLLMLGGKWTFYNYGHELHFQLYGAEKWTGEIAYFDSVYGLDFMSTEIGLTNIAEHPYTSVLQLVLAIVVVFFFVKASKKLAQRSVKKTLRDVSVYTAIFALCICLLPRFSQRGDYLHFSSPEGIAVQLPVGVLVVATCIIWALVATGAVKQVKGLVRK